MANVSEPSNTADVEICQFFPLIRPTVNHELVGWWYDSRFGERAHEYLWPDGKWRDMAANATDVDGHAYYPSREAAEEMVRRSKES
jgi:hypothetical protein